MIGLRFMRAAMRGVKAELAAGHSGWEVALGEQQGLTTSGRRSSSGKRVSPDSVMTLSAAFACTKATSQLIGALPAAMYRREGDDDRSKTDGDLAYILTVKPNPEQTALEFWEGMTAQTLLQGNGISEKLMVGSRIVGLRPLLNSKPVRRNGRLEYAVIDRGKTSYLPPEKVFHIRGFGVGDGVGLSAVRYGVQSFGTALAADESAASVFQNALQSAGVFTMPADVPLSAPQRAQLQENLNQFAGSSKAGKAMLLEAGLSWQGITMNPEDAQLLDSRRFSVEDVCRWFGVPPVIVGHSSQGQTMWGTGIEAIMLAWLTTGINPLLRRIERRILADLIPRNVQRREYFEFNREAMLQMDSKAKAEFLSKMATSGTMTAHERRKKLNLPRVDDPNADKLLAQVALAPLQDLGKDET